MPYCPECGVEYRQGVPACTECSLPLEPGSPPPEVFGPEWVPVAAYTSPEEAALARGYLLDAEISAEVISPERRIFPIHRAVASDTVLAVPPEHADEARRLLHQAELGAVILDEEGDELGGEEE